jgi:hypothetical protein
MRCCVEVFGITFSKWGVPFNFVVPTEDRSRGAAHSSRAKVEEIQNTKQEIEKVNQSRRCEKTGKQADPWLRAINMRAATFFMQKADVAITRR